MTKLDEPLRLKSMVIPNRIVRSATWEGLAAKDGAVTDELAALLGRLAAGGAGLVITGFAFVESSGKVAPRMLGIESDRRLDGLCRLTENVHRLGGKIAVQISHGGAESRPALTGGMALMVPSVLDGMAYKRLAREMTPLDIAQVAEAFAAAAFRARNSGFDAVQIQACHGYLISQFLSPRTNLRSDAYGGSIENRARILFEVFEAVRDKVGDDFPVLVKMNASDFIEGGLAFGDALWTMGALAGLGVDAIEVSGGVPAAGAYAPMRMNIRPGDQEAYLAPFAKEVRGVVAPVPVIVVGGIRSRSAAQALLDASADMVALSRPLVRDPGLPERWLTGGDAASECISCNKCYLSALRTAGIACRNQPREE